MHMRSIFSQDEIKAPARVLLSCGETEAFCKGVDDLVNALEREKGLYLVAASEIRNIAVSLLSLDRNGDYCRGVCALFLALAGVYELESVLADAKRARAIMPERSIDGDCITVEGGSVRSWDLAAEDDDYSCIIAAIGGVLIDTRAEYTV